LGHGDTLRGLSVYLGKWPRETQRQFIERAKVARTLGGLSIRRGGQWRSPHLLLSQGPRTDKARGGKIWVTGGRTVGGNYSSGALEIGRGQRGRHAPRLAGLFARKAGIWGGGRGHLLGARNRSIRGGHFRGKSRKPGGKKRGGDVLSEGPCGPKGGEDTEADRGGGERGQ